MTGAICIFAKVPRPGSVKTRLARRVGDACAADLARAFLDDTLTLALGIPSAEVVLALDEAPPPGWPPRDVTIWQQGQGDLGDRLQRVLARAVAGRPWAIALGADSPGMPPAILRDAIASLVARPSNAALLAPSEDGGFTLLGVTSMPEGALADVRWSSPHTLADAEASLLRAGLVVERGSAWFDVDEGEDLDRLEDLLSRGLVNAPVTRELLAQMKSGPRAG